MTPVPSSLDRFGDELHRAAHRELRGDSEPTRSRARLLRRPHVLAGGSLGLAGLATALVLALSAGGAAAPPAFAVTTASDGSVLVHLSSLDLDAVRGAEHELASLGVNGHLGFAVIMGPQSSAPVTCQPDAGVSGPPVKLVLDSGVVPTGEAGAGTWHLQACYLHAGPFPGVSGNTGPGSTGTGNTGPGSTGSGNTGS